MYYRVDAKPIIEHNSCHHYVTLSLPAQLVNELRREQIGTCNLRGSAARPRAAGRNGP